MALQPRRLFVDVQNRTFIASPFSTLPSSPPTWVDEDVESVEIYAVRPSNDFASSFILDDLSSATVKFAVGSTTPAALQTVFTPLATAVTTNVTEVQTGGSFGGTVDEIQRITWTGARPSIGSYAIKFPERTVSSCSVSGKTITKNNHGFYDGQSVRLTNPSGTLGFVTTKSYIVTNAGQSSFQLIEVGAEAVAGSDAASATIDVIAAEMVTRQIFYFDTVFEIQDAIAELGFVVNNIPQIVVSGINCEEVTLYFAGRSGQTAYPNVVIVNSSLAGAKGVTGQVSYNTSEIAALVAAGTLNVTMEVEISEGGVRQTFRQPCNLSPDLITSTSATPLPNNVLNSFQLQSGDGSVFTVSVTNSGELMIAEQ